MRIPANLTFFIDDCHVSANISADGKISLFTSDKKTKRDPAERELITLTLLKELGKDVRDWSMRSEFKNYEITKCNVVISPSWYIPQTTLITRESIKPIIFSESLILDAATENLVINPDVYSTSKDLLLIEKEILYVSLNDYPVPEISMQRATDCKASVYYCYMSKKFNQRILDAIKMINHQAPKITFQSLAKVTSEYTKKTINDPSFLKNGNIVIINFCSYITEIIYVHSETSLNILSLPFGYKEALHSISENTKSDHQATESLLDLYFNDKLRPESQKLVMELLEKLGKDWSNAVMQGMRQLPKTSGPNTKIFIDGIDSHHIEIAKIFTATLAFHTNKNIPVTLFNQIML